MFKLLKSLKPFSIQLLVLLVLVYGQVAATLAIPDYMATIINKGIVAKDSHVIVTTGVMMLGVALLGAICMVGVGFLASRIATGFAKRIRSDVFRKVESFSLAEFDTFSTASLITRSTNDIQQIQTVLVMLLRLVLMAPMMGIWAIFKAYQLAPSMTWIMALAVSVLLAMIITLFTVAVPRFKKLQKMVDRLNLVTREILTGLRVIRAFNTDKFEEKKFDKVNRDLTKLNLFVNRLMVILMPAMMLIMSVTSLAIIWVGAHEINTGNLQIGDMIAFMQYAMQVIFSFLMLSIIFIMVPRASVSAGRVAEVLDTEPEIIDPGIGKKPTAGAVGLVEFEDVAFAYPGASEPVLRGVTFTARPGETTAIVGSTGSGKSTLINLIPRFYDTTSGTVKIDGVDVRDMRMEDLYNRVGYVPQRGVLFSGTVESNLKYGDPHASDLKMQRAARIAQASAFIKDLEGDYDAAIAQGGQNISGGQKQRLAIARAIVHDPEIYLFDDSFSALDFKTDAALRKALTSETKNKTVIIVAQRISTIMSAGKIIVLSDGAIVGQGTHAELLSSCSVYREIASSQLSDEELARHTAGSAPLKEQTI
ncbi:MAG TPA: ABC transporter ATP-binding protein [Candidatus Saccharimonadia bacterium]|nr:ABC transporter ATP-binding protein [Candidatus Saccharimonadia bacterium]